MEPGPTCYFAVWVPKEDEALSKDKSCVLSGREAKELGALLKRNPNARFTKFPSEDEAWGAMEGGAGDGRAPLFESPRSAGGDGRNGRKRLSLPLNLGGGNGKEGEGLKGAEEKDTRFPSPRVQELMAMGREIAGKKNEAAKARIEANPKMLINDCDRPTTVQEGCRYNALHMAAKADNAEMISYILGKVGSFEFMHTLYPFKSMEAIRDQIRYAVDAYLNTPDKMANETPLHFATKFLSVNATRALVEHPWTQTGIVNADGKTPMQIIGSRGDNSASDFRSKVEETKRLFNELYIVPVWRDTNGYGVPTLGPVANYRELGDRLPSALMKNYPGFDCHLLEPCSKHLTPEWKMSSSSIYAASSSRFLEESSHWKIKAYCGPTTKETAEDILNLLLLKDGRVRGDSPNQSLNNSFNTSLSHSLLMGPPGDGGPPATPPRTPRKRLSLSNSVTNSPMLVRNMHTSTPNPSPSKSCVVSPAFLDSNAQRMKDLEKGIERHAMKIAHTYKVQWNEEWRFLNFYGDISSEEGLTRMETQLKIEESSLMIDEDDVFGGPSKLDKNFSLKFYDKASAGSSLTCDENENENDMFGEFRENAKSESDDSFCTALSHLDVDLDDDDEKEEYSEFCDIEPFFGGSKPGKRDFQLFAALKDVEDLEERLSSDRFPMVFQWYNGMKVSGLLSVDELASIFAKLSL